MPQYSILSFHAKQISNIHRSPYHPQSEYENNSHVRFPFTSESNEIQQRTDKLPQITTGNGTGNHQ